MFKRILNKDEQRRGPEYLIMPLVPLRDIVIFPGMVVPLFVGRDKSVNALEQAMDRGKKIFLAAQRNAKTDEPRQSDIYRTGTASVILQLLRLPDGTVKVLVEGEERCKILSFLPEPDFFQVHLQPIYEKTSENVEVEALRRSLKAAFQTYGKHNKKINQEVVDATLDLEDPSRLSDTIAAYMPLKIEVKQKLLEIADPLKRMQQLFGQIRAEVEIIQTEERIKGRVKKQMEKTQREYYLNEQMRAIQKEMGEKDDFKSELTDLEKKIKRKRLTTEAAAKARAEFKKLKLMSPMSAEATVVRNYIDWILSIPWKERSKDKLDIDQAFQVLEEDHYGLDKPKQRILEYLAVQALVKKIKGPILCFVGPPGVGKTSLARSIARSMNRGFIRLSLGGVRDEAEIRGHRRTYIGAMPGKIIQSLRKVKTVNPLFCLDEIDKMSTDFRGDPASALLEVLDPEQNFGFNDHYLDLDYDLSSIFFITTANDLHAIPLPLQDRMEIIHMPGYTEYEKIRIAKGFLIKKQIKANGLADHNLVFSDALISRIIRHYTKEAGVRNLEREIASICRKVAKDVVRNGADTVVALTDEAIQHYLGVPKYRYGRKEEHDEVGLAMGLAWTEFGGDILGIETLVMPGKGTITITGKLGEVMQESAKAALSYVRSRSGRLKLDREFYQNQDIHVHVPEGGIPKDGPSAGITMATSIVSALTRIPVRSDLAMTGEITLRGRVLPIGGLKEKILAAHRALIKTVLIPADNVKDLQEIPAQILEEVNIEPVQHMDDVLRKALVLEDPDDLFAEEEAVCPAVLFGGNPPRGEEIHPH
ncbi:MAG: endopeptidase La [Syntrophobacteraceae bacterium CG07_land_8_20_14_0_80_61_8]|nr:MAG: endopeptidase La [Syntrophobacteraceae bacterium CG07_land_8_20_14_0_80_61_8]